MSEADVRKVVAERKIDAITPCDCGGVECIYVRILWRGQDEIEYFAPKQDGVGSNILTIIDENVLAELCGMVKRGEV